MARAIASASPVRMTMMRSLSFRWLAPLAIAAGVGATWWVLEFRAPFAIAPVLEVPPAGPGDRLALVLTGEGQRPSANVQDLVFALARGGLPTIAIGAGRANATPGSVGERVDAVLRDHLGRWNRSRLVLVGYRGGASMLPFVTNRIGADLRARIDLLALAGLEPRVSFRSWPGAWFARRPRPTDLPVIPELERLRGVPVLCVDRERSGHEGFCASLAPGLARCPAPTARTDREGGGAAVARRVLQAIHGAGPTPPVAAGDDAR